MKNNIPAGSDADYWGYLKFVAKWGEIIKPQITDMNGKVVQKGTTLTQMTRKYWIGKVNIAKGLLLATEKSMKTADENFKRYKQLYPSGASSVRTYQDMRAIYFEALGAYETAKANLIESNIVLEECKYVAPFEGIVSKVFFTSGILSPNPDVIEISQLNPIGIKVEMKMEESNKINLSTPITIYLPSSKMTIGVYNGYFIRYDDGIILSTKNFPRRNNKKNLPELRNWFSVIKFYIDNHPDNLLGVPVRSLLKDEKGYYVWRAKDRKTMQPGKGLDPIFVVEKVYVVPGKLKRLFFGIGCLRLLKEPGNLQLHDIVVSPPSDDLKNGVTVSFPPERYILMPGDTVKVVIGNKD